MNKELLIQKKELLLNLITGNKSKFKITVTIILAILFFNITISFLIIWFLFPVQKFAENKKGIAILICLSFILAFIVSAVFTGKDSIIKIFKKPEIITVYSNTVQKICKAHNECKEYQLLDTMRIAKVSENNYNVYDENNKKIGNINEGAFVKENTEEYKKLKDFKDKITKEYEAEKAQQLADIESKLNKVFYKINLKQYSEDGNGLYDFYILPEVWNTLTFDVKENIFKNCVTYVAMKYKGTNPKAFKVSTKIRSASNSEILAEYSILNGIKVK